MTAALLLSPPVEHWHPRSVAHLSLLREIDALASVYLAALQADHDDAPTQRRMEQLLIALPLCTPSGEIVRVPPAQARRLFGVADACWVCWRQLLALKAARGAPAQRLWVGRIAASVGDLAWAVTR